MQLVIIWHVKKTLRRRYCDLPCLTKRLKTRFVYFALVIMISKTLFYIDAPICQGLHESNLGFIDKFGNKLGYRFHKRGC